MTDLLSTSIGLQAINASFHQSQASFRQLQTRPIQVALVFGRSSGTVRRYCQSSQVLYFLEPLSLLDVAVYLYLRECVGMDNDSRTDRLLLTLVNEPERQVGLEKVSFITAMQQMGMTSVFDIIAQPKPHFVQRLGEICEADGELAYDNAMCYAVQIGRLYREHQVSNGRTQYQGQQTGVRALVDVGPVEPSRIVSRTHTPKAQWWAEQLGRRLVYIVLTLFLVVPAWVATRQHLSNTGGDAAPLDLPVDTTGQAAQPQGKPVAPRTVVASMAPVPAAAVSEIVIRTRGESWITVTGVDGSSLEKGLVSANSERRYATAQVARLTIGNASAVDVENHGRNVDMGDFARANVARFTVSSDGSLVAAN